MKAKDVRAGAMPSILARGMTSLLLTSVMVLTVLPASASGDQPDSALGQPPGTYSIVSGESQVNIPFEIFRGDIRMMCEIAGKPVRMMLDNGYLWDPLLLFGSPVIDSLGLHYEGEEEVGGPGAGSPVEARTASGIVLTFPGIEFTRQTAIVTPESSGFARMWEGTEGQVSATFLKHFVVAIDFDRGLITLTEPSAFRYRGRGVEVPLKPLRDGAWGIPGIIETHDGRRVSLDLMLDLGYNDQIQLEVGGPHRFEVPRKAIEVSLGFGVQGEIRGYLGRLSGIEIGGYTLRDPLAGFVATGDTSTPHDEAMIGLGLLSAFNVVFDYPRHRMFLEPNRCHTNAYEYNMSGMWLRPSDGGLWKIERVLEGSPASEAGLRVGDKITHIEGEPAEAYGFWDLYPLMRQSGRSIELRILRAGRPEQVSMVLRRVI